LCSSSLRFFRFQTLDEPDHELARVTLGVALGHVDAASSRMSV
jgi:hypothetical protein